MPTSLRRIEPLAVDWSRFSWSNGTFDSARRSLTRDVAGVIAVPHHLVLVTLSGGARHQEVRAECGHRYSGEDFSGAVSFVPAGCTRELVMQDVQARWASISLAPDLLDEGIGPRALDLPTFTNVRDPFIASLLGEFTRLADAAQLDASYSEAMALALGHHLARRYGNLRTAGEANAPRRLPAWRMRKVVDYIEAHLDQPISVRELAEQARLSVRHFHRTLRASTGMSPLDFIQARRIERARRRLLEGAPIAQLPRGRLCQPEPLRADVQALDRPQSRGLSRRITREKGSLTAAGQIEAVAHAAHCEQVARHCGVGFELAP